MHLTVQCETTYYITNCIDFRRNEVFALGSMQNFNLKCGLHSVKCNTYSHKLSADNKNYTHKWMICRIEVYWSKCTEKVWCMILRLRKSYIVCASCNSHNMHMKGDITCVTKTLETAPPAKYKLSNLEWFSFKFKRVKAASMETHNIFAITDRRIRI